jgi:hypothetical protein
MTEITTREYADGLFPQRTKKFHDSQFCCGFVSGLNKKFTPAAFANKRNNPVN